MPMRALFVTSEAYPLAKSGGLADVSSALPAALTELGVDVRVLLPAYPSALMALRNPRIEARLGNMLGIDDAMLISGKLPDTGVPVYLVHAPMLYSRRGGLYQAEDGCDWSDNALRFAFLAHASLAVCRGMLQWKPDVVHANDWHAGLLPLLLAQEKARPATVFTIHNLAFQGNFSSEVLPLLGIAEGAFCPDGIEYYGKVSFLKAAIRYSNKITTVSPTYAKEVLTPEFGCGFDGLLRSRLGDFQGILNGIDDQIWNPAFDVHLPQRYSAGDISGKRMCKAELQRETGLEQSPDTPLVGFVSRLAHQKMADVVLQAATAIIEAGTQFVLVGEGDPLLESAFQDFARRFPGKAAVRIGYEERLAHRVQAGADIMLAPARFEPCGLSQLYALKYGTIPIVRMTGGLADTVVDATALSLPDRTATGFAFDETSLDGLMQAVRRALALYREPLAWRRLQLDAMAQDFSWNASAHRYADLYNEVCGVNVEPLLVRVSEAFEQKIAQTGDRR